MFRFGVLAVRSKSMELRYDWVGRLPFLAIDVDLLRSNEEGPTAFWKPPERVMFMLKLLMAAVFLMVVVYPAKNLSLNIAWADGRFS